MVTALNSYTQSFASQNYAARTALDTNAGKSAPASTGNSAATDTVDISAEAVAAQAAAPADSRVAYYQQFRPTYEGFSSYNMALGIVDPSAQPFSQNRSFADVAQAARDSLDTNYKKLKAIGQPYDASHATTEDQSSLFGELDRRALYAVARNEGGIFTPTEQRQARDIMRGQQGMAMGLYNGPTALADKFLGADVTGLAKSFKAGMTFMDMVSAEEKATDAEWATQRSNLRRGYENVTSSKEEDDTKNPLLILLEALAHDDEENINPTEIRSEQ